MKAAAYFIVLLLLLVVFIGFHRGIKASKNMTPGIVYPLEVLIGLVLAMVPVALIIMLLSLPWIYHK